MATKKEIEEKKGRRKSEFLEIHKSIDQFLDRDLIDQLKGEFEDLIQEIMDYGLFEREPEPYPYGILTKKRTGFLMIDLETFEEKRNGNVDYYTYSNYKDFVNKAQIQPVYFYIGFHLNMDSQELSDSTISKIKDDWEVFLSGLESMGWIIDNGKILTMSTPVFLFKEIEFSKMSKVENWERLVPKNIISSFKTFILQNRLNSNKVEDLINIVKIGDWNED
jgi:hypothetical protein